MATFVNTLKEKSGYDVGKIIGKGFNGTVYELNDKKTRVLKVTKDEQEAKVSKLLINKKLKNVVKIYKVEELIFRKKVYFLIEEEKLCSLRNEKVFLLDSFSFLDNCKYLFPIDKIFINKEIIENIELIKSRVREDLLSKKQYEAISHIIAAAEQLNKMNIKWKDFHSDNLMYDLKTNNFKIIDLGFSEAHQPIKKGTK